MELDTSSLDQDETRPQAPQKTSVLSRNDQKWESLKQDVHKVYMRENNTLSQTMIRIEERFGFKASPRKWKAKVKEWGFEKHLSECDMKIVVAKMDKRRRETGKDTVVFHNGVQVPAEKIANFKRRKIVRESDPASPATPGPITYCTPCSDMDSLIELYEIAELDDDFNDLQFSAHGSSSQVEAVGFNVAESNNTNFRAAPKETRILSVIVGSNSDKFEPSLEPVTEKRNAAADEHEQGQECGLLSEAAPQPESLTIQETGDGEHAPDFVVPEVPEVNYPVINERDLVNDALDPPSIELLMGEASLSALSQAIDECFMEGFELDVTISQLLSMLTYVQGHPSHTRVHLSYWQIDPIATLARGFIQLRQHSNAVLLYKRVIKGSCLFLNESGYLNPMILLKYPLQYCRTYLDYEQAILQIVIAGYLNMQLAAKTPSATASQRILRVIERLRSITNPTSSRLDEAVHRKLLSLAQTINWHVGSFACQFRHELLLHALDLADYYSQKEEFEAAEALFQLSLGTPTWPIESDDFSYLSRQASEVEQRYEQHQRRRYGRPYKSRMQRWSITDLPTLPLNNPSLLREEEIDSLVMGLYQSLINWDNQFQQATVNDDSHRTQLMERNGSVKTTILDSETNTGATTSSTTSRQSESDLGKARRAPLPKRKEGLEVVHLDTEIDLGFTTSWTRSYRYGVTRSDSDIPGIDLSRYLIQ